MSEFHVTVHMTSRNVYSFRVHARWSETAIRKVLRLLTRERRGPGPLLRRESVERIEVTK